MCPTWGVWDAGGDDDAFYSPKSSASFSSDASFVSTAENLGRSPFEGEGFGDDLTRASSGPVSACSSQESALKLVGRHIYSVAGSASLLPSPVYTWEKVYEAVQCADACGHRYACAEAVLLRSMR